MQALQATEWLRFMGAMLIFGLYLLILRHVRCWYRRYTQGRR